MKILASLFLAMFVWTFAPVSAAAQKITVILIRHAEKDVSPTADKVDPDLTDEGRARAQRLVKTVKKYKPTDVYSTNFKRTRLTVTPLAEKRRVAVQLYDHRKMNEIYDLIMKSNKKRVVVVGHNVTIPALANMLIKQEKYKQLEESQYNQMWIIKIRNNKIREKLIEY
jgi:broad specificity phosphatase PhoE